jgi:hypothetical protein
VFYCLSISEMINNPFIQIIGIQRSGSNLLRLMLNQFREISAPHPPHILMRFYPLLQSYGSLSDPVNMYKLVNDVCRLVELNPVPWKDISLNRKEIMAQCKTNTLVEIFRVIYRLKADQDKAFFWVCKSMSNVNYTDDLESNGIEPVYIHLVRDGRDVACSFKRAIVGDKHIFHIARNWKNNQEACLRLEEKIDNKRFVRIHYENLIHHPQREMKRLSEFLGIEFKPDIFDFYKSEESRSTASAGEMWENVTKPIITDNDNKFIRELSPVEIEIFERIAGEMLTRLEYSLSLPPAINDIQFTDQQIESFDRENEKLKKDTLRHAKKEDLERRAGQMKLIEEIINRNSFAV